MGSEGQLFLSEHMKKRRRYGFVKWKEGESSAYLKAKDVGDGRTDTGCSLSSHHQRKGQAKFNLPD